MVGVVGPCPCKAKGEVLWCRWQMGVGEECLFTLCFLCKDTEHNLSVAAQPSVVVMLPKRFCNCREKLSNPPPSASSRPCYQNHSENPCASASSRPCYQNHSENLCVWLKEQNVCRAQVALSCLPWAGLRREIWPPGVSATDDTSRRRTEGILQPAFQRGHGEGRRSDQWWSVVGDG